MYVCMSAQKKYILQNQWRISDTKPENRLRCRKTPNPLGHIGHRLAYPSIRSSSDVRVLSSAQARYSSKTNTKRLMPIRFEDSQRAYLLWFMLWQMCVGKWCVCHILCVFDGVFGEPCVGKCLLLPETASLCPIFSHLWEIYKCVCSQRTGRPNIYIAQFR